MRSATETRRRGSSARWRLIAGLGGAVAACGLAAAARAAAAGPDDDMPSVRQIWSRWYSVQALAQTDDGFVWIATDDSLERFDGRRFQSYRSSARVEARDRLVALAAAPGGTVYVALADGRLARLTPGAGALEIVNGGAPVVAKAAAALAASSPDQLWLANADGLWQWRAPDGGRASRAAGAPSAAVSALALDGRGRLWAAAADHVYRGGAGGFERVPVPGRVHALAADAGGVWLAVVGPAPGLYRAAAGGALERIAGPGEGGRDAPRALAAGADGTLWFTNPRGDLLRLRDGRISRRALAFSTRGLLVDREGSIWANTWTGVARMGGARTRVVLGFEGGAGARSAIAVLPARDGATIWASFNDRLVRVRGAETEQITGADRLGGLECFRSLAEASDAEGTLWVTSCRGGVLRLGATTATVFGRADGLPGDSLGGLAIDRDGVVWVAGVRGGLMAFRGGRFVPEPAFARTVIRVVLAARDGGLWLGVPGEGLIRLRGGREERFGAAAGLDRAEVNALYEGGDGALWVGVRGGGFYRFANGRFEGIDERAGFPARNVHGLVEDGARHLWITTDTGLFHVPRPDIEAYFAGRLGAVRAFRYGTADGFETERFSDGYTPAAARDASGRLWLPTISGLVAMSASGRDEPARAPTIVFEEVRIGPRALRAAGGTPLRATADAGDLMVRFTAPAFARAHRVRFRYRLEGAAGRAATWVDADADEDRVARFAGIGPGRYTFYVRAGIDDLGGPESEAALALELARPLRAWLYPIGALAGAVALAFAAQRFRVRRAQRRFDAVLAERNRIARDLHDTLAQGFAGIGYQVQHLEQARNDPAEVDKALATLRTLVRVSRMEARQAIWNLRGESTESRPLVERLRDTAEQAGLSSAAIVELTVEGDARALPAATEQELVRVAQEAMTNALVHGRAPRIDVSIAFGENDVTLEVRDGGAGFDPDAAARPDGGHFGLRGMRERAERLGGKLEIDGEPGRGARVRLTVPSARGRGLTPRRGPP